MARRHHHNVYVVLLSPRPGSVSRLVEPGIERGRRSPDEIRRARMGGVIGVGQGSARDPTIGLIRSATKGIDSAPGHGCGASATGSASPTPNTPRSSGTSHCARCERNEEPTDRRYCDGDEHRVGHNH